jgi:hypothetical protein
MNTYEIKDKTITLLVSDRDIDLIVGAVEDSQYGNSDPRYVAELASYIETVRQGRPVIVRHGKVVSA